MCVQRISSMSSSRYSITRVARSLCSKYTNGCSSINIRLSPLSRQLTSLHNQTFLLNAKIVQHSSTIWDCKSFSSAIQKQDTNTKSDTNGKDSTKHGSIQPEFYRFFGREHRCDEWSNLTPTVSRLIGSQLHRRVDNPLRLICEGIEHHFSDYVKFDFPDPVVTTEQNFDSLLIPVDHVSRSKSDTYYVNKDNLLRSHTSAHQAECLQLLQPGQDRFFCIADVYRRDVIDGTHYPVFHQCEVFRIFQQDQLPKHVQMFETDQSTAQRTDVKQKEYTEEATRHVQQQLKQAVEGYVRFLLGKDIEMRWISAYFPFTHPSFELEILYKDKWVEMLGCGVVERRILLHNGFDQQIAFALGGGLERLAMLKYVIPDIRLFWTKDTGFTNQFAKRQFDEKFTYQPISNHPQAYNDCSFWLPDQNPPNENDFHELVREIGGDLIEQVHLIDDFTDRMGKRSNCYRIVYRSHERTLTKTEVNEIHEQIKQSAQQRFKVQMRS